MTDKNKSAKVFRSMMEFEKEYLPEDYKKELAKKNNGGEDSRGTGLAIEFLDRVRKQLTEE